MNRTVLSVSAAALALIAASASNAADLPRPYTKGPIYQPIVAPFTWQGFYATFNAGYGWADSTITNPAGATSTVHPAGALLGSGFGYNFQTGNFVFGIEGDADYSWMKDTNGLVAPCASCEIRNHYLATVRGRLGYAWDRWLPYFTGGVAFGDITVKTPAGGSQQDNQVGWTLGGGVEYAFAASRWSTKLEYLYTDLGTGTCDAVHCGTQTNADFRANIVRLGLNYRF